MKSVFIRVFGLLVSIPVTPSWLRNLIMWPIATRMFGPKYKHKIKLKDGFSMYGSMEDILSREILFTGSFRKRLWEPSTSLILERFSQQSGEILMAGAHMGYLVLLSALHTKGRVHAFEPIPGLFQKSEDNLKLNPELRARITLTQAALGEDKGEITMYSEDIRSSVIPYGGGHITNQNKVIVPITTIDDYCKKAGVEKLDLILLDIEGFEWFALNGAKEVLKSLPTLILEISPKILSKTAITPEMMFSRLANLGYSISFIDDHDYEGQTVEYREDMAQKFLEREYVNILATPLNE